ncbi:TPA: HAD family phosphatase, partial [Streptococcus agalactiae]
MKIERQTITIKGIESRFKMEKVIIFDMDGVIVDSEYTFL